MLGGTIWVVVLHKIKADWFLVVDIVNIKVLVGSAVGVKVLEFNLYASDFVVFQFHRLHRMRFWVNPL